MGVKKKLTLSLIVPITLGIVITGTIVPLFIKLEYNSYITE